MIFLFIWVNNKSWQTNIGPRTLGVGTKRLMARKRTLEPTLKILFWCECTSQYNDGVTFLSCSVKVDHCIFIQFQKASFSLVKFCHEPYIFASVIHFCLSFTVLSVLCPFLRSTVFFIPYSFSSSQFCFSPFLQAFSPSSSFSLHHQFGQARWWSGRWLWSFSWEKITSFGPSALQKNWHSSRRQIVVGGDGGIETMMGEKLEVGSWRGGGCRILVPLLD